jgi:1-acyl-sn-glycerol-3-phosphate acyltransferase
MLIARSILFNVLFFFTIAVAMAAGFPLIFLDKKYVFIFWRYLSIVLGFITEKVAGIKYVVENEENILPGPVIYAIRHESIWETLILISRFENPVFVLKEELLKIPLFGAMSKKAGAIAIDRNNGARTLVDAIGKVEDSLVNGHPVIIFPEGTRMTSGEHISLKRGIVWFYEKANCPVVPVIHNSGKFWPRRGFLKKPGTIAVKFHNPINPGLSRDQFMDKLNEIFSQEIERLKAV